MNKTIFFSVGEPSGDQHAARLIRALKAREPELQVRGFGGQEMHRAGCTVDLDLTEHAVVGILEVLPKLREFFRFADQAEAIFAAGGVDAVVLVDFPGFNWHIAKRAKKYGIPVIYFCPPQLWAWGAWRVKKMKATVDHVLAVLPIEEQFFSGHGIPTSFVGHPFFDAVSESTLDTARMQSLRSAASESQTVAVLPGSRTHEVHRNWPVMLDAIAELSAANPQARFAIAAYREKHFEFCQATAKAAATETGKPLPIDFYLGATSEVVEHAACAMMVSGSVSLELMARQTPAAVIYRVGRFLYAFGKCVVKVDSMTLPNLMPEASRPVDSVDLPNSTRSCQPDAPARGGARPLADACGPKQPGRLAPGSSNERVFPEIVSVGNPAKARDFLVATVGRMMNDADYLATKRQQLAGLQDRYAKPGASDRAASKILELLPQGRVADLPRRAA
ncbi:lipid-A-disaccharide synthase [Planctomycetes bacterium TBK1r]|uniref:Lipid-A-disaccharide synthase n=1 Tax=Stieleria magnilauensis TaxID=2527963 RepID=A0ABX5XUH6_9BACT|nr:Glycosyl transferase [Planctomycetes bacterium TBK1r]